MDWPDRTTVQFKAEFGSWKGEWTLIICFKYNAKEYSLGPKDGLCYNDDIWSLPDLKPNWSILKENTTYFNISYIHEWKCIFDISLELEIMLRNCTTVGYKHCIIIW